MNTFSPVIERNIGNHVSATPIVEGAGRSGVKQSRTAALDEKSVRRKGMAGLLVFYGVIAAGLVVLAICDRPGSAELVAASPSQSASLAMRK